MKIAVYTIKTVVPAADSDEYHDFCDLFSVPSLRFGSVQIIGKFSHWINKSEFKKLALPSGVVKYYDEKIEGFRQGTLVNINGKMFAQYIS